MVSAKSLTVERSARVECEVLPGWCRNLLTQNQVLLIVRLTETSMMASGQVLVLLLAGTGYCP